MSRDFKDFAEREFVFDRRTGRYRVAKGSGEGQFISREAVYQFSQDAIERSKERLVSLADDLNEFKIDLREFQIKAATELRTIHTEVAGLAAGGFENVTPEDWLSVARRLKSQYYSGRDIDTQKRYGIKWLAKDIEDGKVSLAQLKQRLTLFANSSKETHWDMKARKGFSQGFPYAMRVLGATDQHCAECPIYAAMPPQPVSSIIRPTQRCTCRNNCRCSLRFLSLEEAVRLGAQIA